MTNNKFQFLKVLTCSRFSDTEASLRNITPRGKNERKHALTDMNSPRTTNTLSAVSVWPVITNVVNTTKLTTDRPEKYNAPLIAWKNDVSFTALVSRLNNKNIIISRSIFLPQENYTLYSLM